MDDGGEHAITDALARQVAAQRALDLAYGHLAKRDRTVSEVRAHLLGKEVEPEFVDGAVDELIEQRYLDDARYATMFAEDRRSLDGWGRDRIARRLRELGIDRETVEAAVNTHDTGAERDAAVALLGRRFVTAPADERGRERALGFLARKGYDLDVAYDAVRAFERAAADA